jgi:hypothetical protein
MVIRNSVSMWHWTEYYDQVKILVDLNSGDKYQSIWWIERINISVLDNIQNGRIEYIYNASLLIDSRV